MGRDARNLTALASVTHDRRFDLVTTLLNNAAGGFEAARPLFPVHASALTDQTKQRRWCGREVLLVERHGLKLEKHWVPTALRFTYDAGARQQDELTNKYLQAYAWGDWRCPVCHKVRRWSGYPEVEHEHAGVRHAWRYSEAVFKYAGGALTASIDLFIRLPGREGLRLVEFKILNDEEWTKITMPLAEHSLRTRMYLYVVSRDKQRGPMVDASRASVIYVSRSHGRRDAKDGVITPFREFVIDADFSEPKTYLRKLAAMREARDAGKLVPRICETPNETRAKHCNAKAVCFR